MRVCVCVLPRSCIWAFVYLQVRVLWMSECLMFVCLSVSVSALFCCTFVCFQGCAFEGWSVRMFCVCLFVCLFGCVDWCCSVWVVRFMCV